MKYSNNEYINTQNTSTAAERMIRAQAEQIRETPAEYIARKCGIRGDADGQESNLRLRGCKSTGKRD